MRGEADDEVPSRGHVRKVVWALKSGRGGMADDSEESQLSFSFRLWLSVSERQPSHQTIAAFTYF